MTAKALRNIDRLAGKPYKAGDSIPDAVIAQISGQVLRSLVDSRTIEVAGMDAGGGGGAAHVQARLDRQDDRIKKLEAAVSTLTGNKSAKTETAPKAVKTKAQGD